MTPREYLIKTNKELIELSEMMHPLSTKMWLDAMEEYSQNQRQSLPIDSVSKSYSEKDMDMAYDKGYSDGLIDASL